MWPPQGCDQSTSENVEINWYVGVAGLIATGLMTLFFILSSGRDCSIIPTCSNVSDCSGRGICIDYDVCKCDKEWTGKDCTQFSCGSLDHCSGRSVLNSLCFVKLFLQVGR